MRIQILGSSSDGCAYLINEEVLLDCGVKYTGPIDFCLVTHAHIDHRRHLQHTLMCGATVYMHPETLEALKEKHHRVIPIETGQVFKHGNYTITSFELKHDVLCLGFIVRDNRTREKLVYATDTQSIPYNFTDVTHYLVECNHSKEIINKRAIAGEGNDIVDTRAQFAHMSLEKLETFFSDEPLEKTKSIHLLHLSSRNAEPEEFQKRIQKIVGQVPVIIAKEAQE